MRFSLGLPLSASGVQHWLNASWALDCCGSAWTLTDTRTAMASTPRARTLGVRRVVLSPAPALVGSQTGINASLPSTPPTEAQISGVAAADFALLASLAGECRRALASPANGVIVPVKCISSKQGCARVGSRYVGHEADVECVA